MHRRTRRVLRHKLGRGGEVVLHDAVVGAASNETLVQAWYHKMGGGYSRKHIFIRRGEGNVEDVGLCILSAPALSSYPFT